MKSVILVGLLVLLLTLAHGAYPEAKCTAKGGECMDEDSCTGTLHRGLCPTQPRSIKCCVVSNPNSDSDSDTDNLLARSGATAQRWLQQFTGNSGDCGCEYDYATYDRHGSAPGAIRLGKYFVGKFGGRYEIYNPRNIGGSSRLSLHAEGRAVDLYLSGNAGQQAFNHAVAIACSNGIQEVIFNHRIWTNGRTRVYNGQNPHTDHVHIGLNKCGAENFS